MASQAPVGQDVTGFAGSLAASIALHCVLLMALAFSTSRSTDAPRGISADTHPTSLAVFLPARVTTPGARRSDDKPSPPAAASAAGSSDRGIYRGGAPVPDAAALGSPPAPGENRSRWLSVPVYRYHPGSELTKRPRPRHHIQPEFPYRIEEATNAGRIVLRLYIGESGRVDDVVIERSALPKAFEDSARRAFAEARFAPGEIDGVPVKSRMRVEVTFESGTLSAPPP